MGSHTGVEPALPASQAGILPLNEWLHKLVPRDGVKPPSSSNRLEVLSLDEQGKNGAARTDRSAKHSATLWGLQLRRRLDFYAPNCVSNITRQVRLPDPSNKKPPRGFRLPGVSGTSSYIPIPRPRF